MPFETRTVARLVAAILLMFLFGLPAMAAPAASPYDARFAHAEHLVRTYQPAIAEWERQSQISFGLGLAIAALSMATGLLQLVGRRWTRPATVVFAASIASLAVVNVTRVDGGSSALDARAREGRMLVASAERFIALAPFLPTDADREDALRYLRHNAEALAVLHG